MEKYFFLCGHRTAAGSRLGGGNEARRGRLCPGGCEGERGGLLGCLRTLPWLLLEILGANRL